MCWDDVSGLAASPSSGLTGAAIGNKKVDGGEILHQKDA
jgi:hypothetical protein